jgi:CRISPR/Cas system-associated exonuclease Cas4 (RecB family)
MRTSGFELNPDLKATPLGQYRGKAVSASSMGEYWYCSAKVLNSRLYGHVETEETETGSEYHEEVTTKVIGTLGPLRKVRVESVYDAMKLSHDNISNALKGRKILANSEETVLFWAIHPEWRYIGVPDKADCTNGKEPVIMDLKTTGRLPGEAWIDHRIQLGAYMLGVEQLGFRQSYGIVRYVLRNDPTESADFKVYLDDYLRLHVSTTSEAVHKILDGGQPQPTKNPNKCRVCSYNDVCKWSLTRAG